MSMSRLGRVVGRGGGDLQPDGFGVADVLLTRAPVPTGNVDHVACRQCGGGEEDGDDELEPDAPVVSRRPARHRSVPRRPRTFFFFFFFFADSGPLFSRFWLSTCSGSPQGRATSTPPRRSPRPRGSRCVRRVPLEAGVEEASRILQRRALRERELHVVLVRLAGADHPVVLPHRDASPLPLLHDIRVGLLDQRAQRAERLAPPVAELLDPLVDNSDGDLLSATRSCS